VTPAPPTQDSRRFWWVVGSLGVAAMTAVAVWFGLAATAGRVHWVNTGYVVESDTSVQVRFDLRREPDRAVTCAIEALDERHATVGSTEVSVGPAISSPSRHLADLRTVARATTGYVDRCWYADEAP